MSYRPTRIKSVDRSQRTIAQIKHCKVNNIYNILIESFMCTFMCVKVMCAIV